MTGQTITLNGKLCLALPSKVASIQSGQLFKTREDDTIYKAYKVERGELIAKKIKEKGTHRFPITKTNLMVII
ncbi:hypothetical protein JMN32_19760 [Fulvivirga sp. 29W222]|uniref:Uncharacterized protein n=1 Tax=Fulvivirga marina TaxID=2494733 RepID=A0A937G104_9BACT|nr:hypothetical protein [Fulvivirga marina]MBL6448557.1 hypothetical protein [Fulvivirga marina]